MKATTIERGFEIPILTARELQIRWNGIDNARRNLYPDDRHAPPKYGIEEMVKYRYGN